MRSILRRLSSASSALLGVSTPLIADSEPWIVDLGVMNYIEQDRNTGLEMIARGTRDLADGSVVSLSSEIDVITGATPNGATSSNVPQTFTMSSGVGTYSVGANELPADGTHMDTRLAVKAALDDRLSSRSSVDYHALISMEFDYLALGVGAMLSQDFNQQNTTLLAGFNYEYNAVHPVGNAPIPFARMQPAGQQQPRGFASEDKRGQEFSLGLNQVIDRASIFQIKLTYSHFSGYLNDPYKILSIIDDVNPATLGATTGYVFEGRPDTRRMESVYLAYNRHYDSGIFNINYRFYQDSWELQSHTTEIAFRFNLANRYFLRPGLRLYRQDAASFYRHSLRSSEAFPQFASADARLAEFDAQTLSLEYGRQLAFDRKHSFTLEYYTQQGDSSPADAVGLQRQQDLYPRLRTLVLRYVLSLEW